MRSKKLDKLEERVRGTERNIVEHKTKEEANVDRRQADRRKKEGPTFFLPPTFYLFLRFSERFKQRSLDAESRSGIEVTLGFDSV